MAAAVLLAAFGPSAFAFTNTGTVTLYQNSYSYGNGGEFTAISSTLDPTSLGYSTKAQVTINGKGTGFETFCLEYTQEFNPGTAYNYGISNAAIAGGPASSGSGSNYRAGSSSGSDPISIGVAWLYTQFAAGTLNGYNYTNTASRLIDAGELQQTIWWLEDENYSNGSSPKPNNIFTTDVLNMFGTALAAEANNNGAYGVAVMNLGSSASGYPYQDQLILYPTPTTNRLPVPDGGASVMLLGLALGGIAMARRKLFS